MQMKLNMLAIDFITTFIFKYLSMLNFFIVCICLLFKRNSFISFVFLNIIDIFASSLFVLFAAFFVVPWRHLKVRGNKFSLKWNTPWSVCLIHIIGHFSPVLVAMYVYGYFYHINILRMIITFMLILMHSLFVDYKKLYFPLNSSVKMTHLYIKGIFIAMWVSLISFVYSYILTTTHAF